MTQLLVSVRDREEALIAANNGADIIDVKEPRLGALGCAEPQVVCEIVTAVCRSGDEQILERRLPPLSLAMGELVDGAASFQPDWRLPHRIWRQIQYVKVGCRDCDCARWRSLWNAWQAELPAHVFSVAVAYADHKFAGSPPSEDVLKMATKGGASAFLLDTFAKKSSHLFDFFSASRLESLVGAARENGLLIAIAGSLKIRDLPRALAAKPDVIGVRGAACGAARDGALSGSKVAELAAAKREMISMRCTEF